MSDETKPKCAFCGAPLKRGEHRVCRRCAAGVAASMTPVATCDGCGRPIHWGNLPNGIPNGVTLKDCGGVPGNDVTLCAACLVRIGAGKEAEL